MAKKESFAEIIFKFYILLVFVITLPTFFSNTAAALRTFFIAVFVPILIYFVYKTIQRYKFFESKKTLEDLRSLTPRQFEQFIAHLFQKMGYKTEAVGGAGDGGIDVIAEKDGLKYYIQCKKFITRQVGVGAMRDFYGAVVDKLSGSKAYFITTNIFTAEAEKFAEGKPIVLIDGQKLMQYVHQAGGIDIPETSKEVCPRCGGLLVERNGKFGKFLGCKNYPKCKYTQSGVTQNAT